jgi:cell division transport system permease protein
MFSRFTYLLLESFRGLLYNKFMTFVVIANIALSLFFVSVFIIVFLNLNRVIESTEEKITFEAFIEERAPTVDIMKKEILNTEGVEDALYISKQEAVEIFQQEVGQEILTAADGNPLPASFKIKINKNYRTPERLELIRESLKSIPFVEEVSAIKDWVPKLQKVRNVFVSVSLVAIIVILFAVFFMVFSTIRVTYLARRDLIRVLELVGASENAIRVPFIVEGALKGLFGGLFASLILALAMFFVRQSFPEIEMYRKIFLLQTAMGLFLGCTASIKSIPTSDENL